MAPHTRTRTGCWTCREAGYKCDEQKPFCGRCTRLKITCKGYGVKFKWKNTTTDTVPSKSSHNSRAKSVEHSMALSPMSTSSIISAPPILDGSEWGPSQEWNYRGALSPATFSPDLVPDLSIGDKRLLHYWIEQLSSLISITPRATHPSPFQVHLTAMASIPGALRSTVLSMAANHLSLVSGDTSLKLCAYRHQRDAIRLLQHLIQTPTASESALATVLMMQISTRLFGEDDAEPHVANHLIGAKAMVAHRRGGVAAWGTSSSARFLLSLFAYHDILSSVSRGSPPLLDHGPDFDAIEGVPSMQGIAKVLHIVGRISELQDLSRSVVDRSMDPEFSIRFQVLGSGLEIELLGLDLSASSLSSSGIETADICLTAEAYRHAAFIYLYRVWMDIGAPSPVTLHHVKRCLTCIEQVNVESPLVSSHIWPLFTAGCEAMRDEERQFVRDRFTAMFQSRKFPVMKRIVKDIEDVWAFKDLEHVVSGQDGMVKVDCIQVILKQRGREVDLA